jgi:hypothetical protein
VSVEDLLLSQPEDWLATLPSYQREPLEQLLASSEDPMAAASKWLSSMPADTYPFGGTREPRPLADVIVAEVRAYLCGDPRYEKDRTQLGQQLAPTHAWFVSALTSVIGKWIGGATAVLIAPIVVLGLISLGKIGINAFCAVWKESAGKPDGQP